MQLDRCFLWGQLFITTTAGHCHLLPPLPQFSKVERIFVFLVGKKWQISDLNLFSVPLAL